MKKGTPPREMDVASGEKEVGTPREGGGRESPRVGILQPPPCGGAGFRDKLATKPPRIVIAIHPAQEARHAPPIVPMPHGRREKRLDPARLPCGKSTHGVSIRRAAIEHPRRSVDLHPAMPVRLVKSPIPRQPPAMSIRPSRLPANQRGHGAAPSKKQYHRPPSGLSTALPSLPFGENRTST